MLGTWKAGAAVLPGPERRAHEPTQVPDEARKDRTLTSEGSSRPKGAGQHPGSAKIRLHPKAAKRHLRVLAPCAGFDARHACLSDEDPTRHALGTDANGRPEIAPRGYAARRRAAGSSLGRFRQYCSKGKRTRSRSARARCARCNFEMRAKGLVTVFMTATAQR